MAESTAKRQSGTHPPKRRIAKAARSILSRQLPDGGFNIYAHGPSEVSATIKAYTALKLSGLAFDDPDLVRARERILALGGLQAANSYVKINLSLFGLYPREHAPSIPPEMMLLGNLIYEMSSWTRAIVIPLSVLRSSNIERPVPAGFTLDELFVPGVPLTFSNNEGFFGWRNFFLKADRILKLWDRFCPRVIRTRAIHLAEQWVLEHARYSGGLGAIYPSMMYTIMMLDLLEYPKNHPDRVEAEDQFMNLLVDDDRGFFFQPCFSVVWDTAIVAYALGESGEAPCGALERTADWLVSKEIRRKGDWSIKRPNVEPSGWYFEFANEFYPDIDDTAQVLLALNHAPSGNPARQEACVRRAVNWLLAMQGSDGGWAAFDVDNNWHFLSAVPFADHNAMLDPTCPDITGRVLEALMACGVRSQRPGRAPRGRVSQAHPGNRRKLVRALGCGLRLRHLPGSARPARRRRRRPRMVHPARRGVAALHSERRWRLGRKLRQLRQPDLYAGPQHSLADRLGRPGTARQRGHRIEQRDPRRRMAGRASARRRRLGRRSFHRHRFPARVLLEVSSVPKFVSGSGACRLPESSHGIRLPRAGDFRSQRSSPLMRVPFSQVADMATYIAKNKIRPRPEWQKNLASEHDEHESLPHRPLADPRHAE